MSANSIDHENELLKLVRSAASEFVSEVERGRRAGNDWSDAEITDQVVTSNLNKLIKRLMDTGVAGKDNQLASSELWKIAGHVLKCGELQNHARSKPRGYAGDYQMLHKICNGTVCEDPLGRAFDRFFQNQAAPQVVRNRTQLVADAIAAHIGPGDSKQSRIVSIGSGSGEDILRAVKQLPADRRKRVDIALLDLDADALEFAKQQLSPFLPAENMYCLRTNLYRIARNKQSLSMMQNADFLVCSGLFDYLDQQDAADMLASFWNSLSANGKSMVFNFAPEDPSRPYMEWIGNWYLVYRSANAMIQLARQAKLPHDRFVVKSEELKANHYIEAWK